MNVRELMIDDWVAVGCGLKSDYVQQAKVESIQTRQPGMVPFIRIFDHQYGLLTFYFDSDTIVPVTLEAYMLELNGWSKMEGQEHYYRRFNTLCFLEWRADNKALFVNDGLMPEPVRYVHQMQNVLRACGLELTATTFQI